MSVNTCYRHATYTQRLRLPIRLYMRPHTPIYVSPYSYICVLILVYMCPHTPIRYRHAAYTQRLRSYMCVLILVYVCPRYRHAAYTQRLLAAGDSIQRAQRISRMRSALTHLRTVLPWLRRCGCYLILLHTTGLGFRV